MAKQKKQLNDKPDKVLKSLKKELEKYKRINEESEELFKIVFKKAPDAYFMMDLKGNFIDGNEASEKLCGYKKEELIGKSMKKILPGSELPRITKQLALQAMGRPTEPIIFELINKNKKRILVETRGSLVKTKDKKMVLGIARDITKNKKMEQETKDSEERFKTIFEKSPHTYFLIDLKMNIVIGNEAGEKLTGYTNNDLVGKHISQIKIMPVDQLPRAIKAVTEHILGKGRPTEIELLKKNEERISVEATAKLIKIKGKRYLLGIVHDITEKKKKGEELKRKNEELEKFNKLAIGREMEMIRLKKRVRELEEKSKN